MYGSVVSRRLGAVVIRLVVIGLAIATDVAVLGAPDAMAATKCSGYDGCNVAPYTTHVYNSTTNHTSYWGQYVGDNCTNYVAYLLVTLDGMPNRQPWSGDGNAYNWGVAESAITDRTPVVGAVAWWPARYHGAGSLGHVAYVEAVTGSGAIVVSEDSYPADGVTDYSGDGYDWRMITRGRGGWPRGFIHFTSSRQTATVAGRYRTTAVRSPTGLAAARGPLRVQVRGGVHSRMTLRQGLSVPHPRFRDAAAVCVLRAGDLHVLARSPSAAYPRRVRRSPGVDRNLGWSSPRRGPASAGAATRPRVAAEASRGTSKRLGTGGVARGSRYDRATAMRKLARIPNVTSVVVLPPYGLQLTFDDGVHRDVDLADELWGPVFEPLRDPDFFAQVAVDHGTVVWPNGVDLDPVVLHGDAEPTAAGSRHKAG